MTESVYPSGADGSLVAGTTTHDPAGHELLSPGADAREPIPDSGLADLASSGLRRLNPHPPLPRWRDERAELPALRAQLQRAERKRDVERERLVAAALARALVKRRTELDIAVRLGRRAVLLGEDGLRSELAAWHCQLGQPALGVGMLLPLLETPGLDRARLCMRVALYQARLGQGEAVLAALREAAAFDPDDPLIPELQAMIHGWAPQVTSAEQSAEAYLRGAERRRARRDEKAAFQDVLRAFDVAPADPRAASALAQLLSERGQTTAVDEAWRRHADALIEAGQAELGVAVHRRRLEAALAAGRFHEALTAAFDAGLDAEIDAERIAATLEAHAELRTARERGGSEPKPALADIDPPALPLGVDAGFDALALRLGLNELVAARLELAAESARGPVSSRCYLALGNLLEQVIGSTERALEPWILAVVSDPESSPARASLRRYAASTGDYTPLIEALERVAVEAAPGSRAGALGCVRELYQLACDRLDDPGLAQWCVEIELRHAPDAEESLRARAELAEPAERALRALQRGIEELEQLGGEQRVPVLRQLAAGLRGRPDRAQLYREVLEELAARRPAELRWRRLLDTLLARLGERDSLSSSWTRDLMAEVAPNSDLRALIGLSRLERQTGNLQGALAVLAADDGRGLAPAASMQLCLAAQLGQRRLRAEGLLKLAVSLPLALRGWLASVAALELRSLGEHAAALRAAEVATHADPTASRPLIAFAFAARGRRDRVAAVAYERAMGLAFPDSALCRMLVEALDELGDMYATQLWTGRWLALRPAETAAAVALLRSSAKSGDAARLGDVVQWAVSQAHPLEGWAVPLARALITLVSLDRARAVRVAWRVVDAFGPAPQALAEALRTVAIESGDAELEVALIERELGSDASVGEAALWRLVQIHEERGEPDRACAVLVRVLGAGLDAERVLSVLAALGETHSPEGEFHRLQATAQALEARGDRSEECIRALREYGAALWDLARDPAQAIEVWMRAAELGGARGWFDFARDLVEVLGLERALDEVARLAESVEPPEHVAALLAGAAVVAQHGGARRRALQLGLLALDSDPANIWALSLIESAAGEADLASVEGAYRSALRATLGAYGERALHYRAARFFERSLDSTLALSHAIGAFRAVPSEGVSFALMLRLAQGPKEAERAARAVEEVAVAQSSGALRSQWLRCAARIAGQAPDGAQQRMEVLFRALFAEPDIETLELLSRALIDLSRQQPDGRALGLLRFSRAVAKLLPKLESIDGARVALGMGTVALNCFSDARLALEALSGAVRFDAEVEEFSDFVGEAARLAAEVEPARSFLDLVESVTAAGERGSLGLLELAAEMAVALGRFASAAGYLVWRLERGSESDALAQKAEQAVRKSQQLNLPEHVLRRFPKVAQHAQLLARAEQAAAAADAAAELAALEAAFALDAGLSAELLLRLLALATRAANLALADRVLSVARVVDVDSELLLQATRALAQQWMEQRQPARALALLAEAGASVPDDVALWSQALAAARAAADDESRQGILARLVDASGDAVKKSFWLNEAWELAKQRGDADLATKILRRWLSLDPEDTQALNRLEAEAMAAQNWEELADLLQRHLALGVSVRERRRLSLWRCELLETRLNRLAEARQELSALVERAPADRDLIERYAKLSEALGDAQEAASAWLTASGLSSTRPIAAELAERACRLFLDAGEVMSARRVLAAPQTLPRTLGLAQLAVRLEREGENEPRLARALEELGAVTEQAVSERAGALLEASNLWRRLGDDERACACASQASSLVPDDAEAQLLASYLEYRRGGPRSASEARPTVERLRRVYSSLALDQLDLAGFLLAEALDVVEPGSGMPELTRVRERLGDTPLVSIGIGERLAKGPTPREALPHFDSALLGGDLRGLRKASQVALEAAQVALGSELLGLAHRYAKVAESDPELGEATRRLRDELGRLVPKSMPPSARASRSPEARASRPPETGFSPADPGEGVELETRPARRTQLGLGQLDPRPPAAAHEPEMSAEQAKSRLRFQMPRPSSLGEERPPSSDVMPRVPMFRARSDEERRQYADLESGSAAAGRELASALVRDPERAGDASAVALALLRAKPGDTAALELLTAAAVAGGDHVHAAALRHVQSCLDAALADIPALDAQLERVDVLRRLLFSSGDGQPPKALEVVWESTRRVLEWEAVRDIKSAVRIRADDRSPLARAYFAIARLFGLAPTPLVQLVMPRESRVSVIVLGEPSVLVRGDPGKDTAQLRYDLGAALAGTLPAYAIVNAATYEQIDDLFRAVHSAFGPPESSQTSFTSTSRLAALLWESLPPRTQRLMTEWCRDGKLTRELAVAAARRAARRAGLFACGSLGIALGRVMADEGIDQSEARGPEGLAPLCARSTAAADLVRLASDPLYAHLRWRTDSPPPGGPITRRGL